MIPTVHSSHPLERPVRLKKQAFVLAMLFPYHRGGSPTSTRDVTREIAEAGAGETVKLGIWRKGESVIVDVELGQRPRGMFSRQLAELSPSHADTRALGLTLEPLKPGSDPQAGVLITDVQAGSEAAARQLRPGMVIRMVEGEAVESPQAIANLYPTRKLLVNARFGCWWSLRHGAGSSPCLSARTTEDTNPRNAGG